MDPTDADVLYEKVQVLENSFEQFKQEISAKLELIENFLLSKNEITNRKFQDTQVVFNDFATSLKKSGTYLPKSKTSTNNFSNDSPEDLNFEENETEIEIDKIRSYDSENEFEEVEEYQSEEIKIEGNAAGFYYEQEVEDTEDNQNEVSEGEGEEYNEAEIPVDIDLTQDSNSNDWDFSNSANTDQIENEGFQTQETSQSEVQDEQLIPISILQPTPRVGRNPHMKGQPPEVNGKVLCTLCHSYFHRNSLRRHMRQVHGSQTVPPSNRIRAKLRAATATVPPIVIRKVKTISKYKCDVCPQDTVVFYNSALLIQHITSFHGKPPVGCGSCDQVFFSHQNLRRHQEQSGHNNNGSYKPGIELKRRIQCIYCPRAYQTRADLEVHVRTHTGEKPFKCDICKRHFADIRNLKRHRRICWSSNNPSASGSTITLLTDQNNHSSSLDESSLINESSSVELPTEDPGEIFEDEELD